MAVIPKNNLSLRRSNRYLCLDRYCGFVRWP